MTDYKKDWGGWRDAGKTDKDEVDRRVQMARCRNRLLGLYGGATHVEDHKPPQDAAERRTRRWGWIGGLVAVIGLSLLIWAFRGLLGDMLSAMGGMV